MAKNWIAHTKKFAKDHGISYQEAMADPRNKEAYHKAAGGAKKKKRRSKKK